jgi:hypothetical protein
MKKMLRKIMVLALAATLFVMPASTALAASQPVVLNDADGNTLIGFQPDPLSLQGGGSNFWFLDDITSTDLNWYVPAGKSFNFQIFTNEANTTTRIQIFRNGTKVSDYVSSSTSYGYSFRNAPESNDVSWSFCICPYTDMTIAYYAGSVYE